ncbi:AUGMIN subunit 8-like isoform X1 [Musa acuminata AAA Group]|uniref:AUGMIN subunit 8-like isoform X1 n=1 Tax=Musa acuminata AAA Group TaxID=214697 RepID=UPI0031E25F92
MLLKSAQREDTLRLPLVLSENNAMPIITSKSRAREVSSRYGAGMSSTTISNPSTPRRCSSPTASRTSPVRATSQTKRAQSAERRRPIALSPRFSTPTTPSSRPSTPSHPSSTLATPIRDTVTEMHDKTRRLLSSKTPDGLWPSMRSLSSSFQSESVSVPDSKTEKVVAGSSSDHTVKPSANGAPERKRTPLRGRNTPENSCPMDNLNARVIDQHRWPGMLGRRVSANALARKVIPTDKISRSASLSVPSRGVSPKRTTTYDSAARDFQQPLTEAARRPYPDGSGRMKQDAKLDVNTSSQLPERSSLVAWMSTTHSTPIKASQRSSSPSRILSLSLNTSRGMQSPSRTRLPTSISSSGNGASQACDASSVLNYAVEVQKGKKNASHIEAAHQLRLLHNAVLQWQFVNAQADDTVSIQKNRAEKILYSASNTISKLRDFIIRKRNEVEHLRRQMKLVMILRNQVAYLDCWTQLEREYDSSLSESIEVFKASTLYLPVSRGARADVFSVKNAVSSAVDAMQAMGLSVCYLLSKVKNTQSMISELSVVSAKEMAMLAECRELLASVATMQVQESSLRTYLLQLRHGGYKMK